MATRLHNRAKINLVARVLFLHEVNKERGSVRLFYSAFDSMSDQEETEDSVTPGGMPTITKSTWKRKRRKTEMAAKTQSRGPDRVPSTSPLSSLADSRASRSALTSSVETTTATGDRTTGSETNCGRGDRHDPGQDNRTGNPCRDHHLFAQSLTSTFATQSETGISSTEVTEKVVLLHPIALRRLQANPGGVNANKQLEP